jgi:ribose/xylose/arabinose/galactoside ABC-type transport system permease subunit
MVSPLRSQEMLSPDLPHFCEKFSWRMITTLLWTVLLACTAGGLWWYGQGASEHFLSDPSLENMWRQIIPIALLVGPIAVIMLGGGLDLSIGAVVGLASALAATAMADGKSPEEAFILVMMVSGGIGLLHALLVGVALINPIVLTLVTTVLIHGGARLVVGDEQNILFGENPGILELLHNSPLLLSVATAVSLLLIQLAQVGGGSCGLPVARQPWHRRTFFIALPYVLSSLAAGVVGCSLTGRLRMGSPAVGSEMALMVILAAVIGGNCTGRRFGTVIGAIAGAAILVAAQNIMIIEAVAQGMILLIIASSAGVALLLSQLTYWIINVIYRNSRPTFGA